VVCLAASVPLRGWDEGHEDRTAGGAGLAMQCAGRMAYRVRHRPAGDADLLLRRLQRDWRPGDAHNGYYERVHRPYSHLPQNRTRAIQRNDASSLVGA
jgi:hypothetical protein